MRLPFADAVFDAVTISFGLRNVVDTTAALAEMLRVTRPGGRLVVTEFSTPTDPVFRTVYTEYLMRALPSVARAVSRDPDAYVYLAESIRGLAGPGRARASGRPSRVGPGGLPQPVRRDRRPAPRSPPPMTDLGPLRVPFDQWAPSGSGAGRALGLTRLVREVLHKHEGRTTGGNSRR